MVAGCSSGIGEHLLLHYSNDPTYEVAGLSRNIGTYLVDATNPSPVFHAINQFKPEILINCIGLGGMNHSLMTSTSQYDMILDNNLKTTFLLCREAGRHMLKSGYGRIINFGSCAVAMEIEGEAVYAAAKSAVLSFSRILAKELAPHITVNCISPGPVDTRLIARVKPQKIQDVINRQIIKKMATFEDIRRVCDFLISSEMITGQNIYINGAG